MGVDATAAGNDGRITGVDETMEYARAIEDTDTREWTWVDCAGEEVTGLSAGTYAVRYKAKPEEEKFASDPAEVLVKAPIPADGLCLNDGSIRIYQDGDVIIADQEGAQYICSDGEIKVTGNGEPTTNYLYVMYAEKNVALTLSGVKQIDSENSGFPLVGFDSATATLKLEGTNTLFTSENAMAAYDSNLTIVGSGTWNLGSESQRGNVGIYMHNSSLSVNGGTVDIHANDAAMIMGYGSGSLEINGGVIRADVLNGGDEAGLGTSEDINPHGSMKVGIHGGTVELSGKGDWINSGSNVTIDGGSVTAGGVKPQPTNGTDNVYPVTIEDVGTGSVSAFLLKQGNAAYPYGAPACATTDGKLTLYLPKGAYSGMAVVDGRLVTFSCAVTNETGNSGTATDTGIRVTGTVTLSEDGSVIVPEGGSVQIGDTTVTLPEGGKVEPNGDGTADIPGGSIVKTGDTEITLDDKGGTIGGDGSVTLPEGGTIQIGDTTVTLPEGGKVEPNGDGTADIPGGSTVKTGDTEIIIGDQGGTVDDDGSVTLPEGGTVQIGDTTVTLPEGGTLKPDSDGNIPLPGGATVEKDGNVITIPECGGILNPDTGEVIFNRYNVTFVVNGGTIHSGNITDYAYGVGAVLPTDVTRQYYAFGGWYENADFSGSPVRRIGSTATGDKTFYAKWTLADYPVTVEDIDCGSATVGYRWRLSKDISIRNGGKLDITIHSVELDSENAEYFTLEGEVPAELKGEKTDKTFSIRPVTGLEVGTYNAVITVTYEVDGEERTATAAVTFCVKAASSWWNPITGDKILRWAAVLVISGAALAAVVIVYRKKKRK